MPVKPLDPRRKVLTRQQVLDIVHVPSQTERVRAQRMTQDTPISTDVWYRFGEAPNVRHEILLAPNRRVPIHKLFEAARAALAAIGATPRVIYNQSHVLVEVTFEELVRGILPLSMWWVSEITAKDGPGKVAELLKESAQDRLALLMDPAAFCGQRGVTYGETLLHMIRIIGYLAVGEPMKNTAQGRLGQTTKVIRAVGKLFADAPHDKVWARLKALNFSTLADYAPLWRAFTNRAVQGAVFDSRKTIKADAAGEVFGLSCKNLRWAVVDSGIDATHPAFSCAPPDSDEAAILKASRIRRTYDFTRLKTLMYGDFSDLDSAASHSEFAQLSQDKREELKSALQDRVQSGQAIDWDLLEPALRMRHAPDTYVKPENQHGTHVAGILASGDWTAPNGTRLLGMCPDLDLYDVRVFDAAGSGDEFTVLAALQFIRHINLHQDTAVVQGVNLSFSLLHIVESYACGSTPVCEECTRLIGAGIVVVAAAGNCGYQGGGNDGFGDYRNISITDPGNAEEVITVGATHREMPHKYGVSYFSSRGPTGDGRMKPDLVAPGEKVTSPVPGANSAMLDGTSMAAPHVSGAAALLMARHKELIGNPRRIKEILCRTATDLGRERSFQGAGLVDVLRALQSV